MSHGQKSATRGSKRSAITQCHFRDYLPLLSRKTVLFLYPTKATKSLSYANPLSRYNMPPYFYHTTLTHPE